MPAESGCEGLVMELVTVVEQPLASAMVTAMGPLLRPMAVGPVWVGTVFQVVVYGAVPPLIATIALPLGTPAQGSATVLMDPLSAAAGPEIKTGAVVVQP
jgi:hypothetical protein